ncbi:MAG: 50S ribosomal protein L24 [Thermoproteota archaeon]|nr:MAG: 50S ribosomal protein L24 [Candidatus Korarchaeota archaeon]
MSSKPSKQRKYYFNAPLHKIGAMMSAHLSDKLREELGIRSLPVRKGDKVRVVRGDIRYRLKEGKIIKVDRKKRRIYIEGITRKKADGTEIPVPIHPSKVEIVEINRDDEERMKIIERRRAGEVS